MAPREDSGQTIDEVRRLAALIISLLADGEYLAVENMTDGRRLSATDLEIAIRDSGMRPAPTPSEKLGDIDVLEVNRNLLSSLGLGGFRRSYSVIAPIWDMDGSLGDLTLELTVRATFDDLLDAEIDNLHVL